MTDLFEEVEEQLRSDRYKALARKGAPWVIAAAAIALIAALGVWGWQQYNQQITDKASQEYAVALTALAQGDAAKATQLFSDVSKSPSKAYRSLALMQLGGLKIAHGMPDDIKAAVTLFDQAASAAPDDMLGDAARLKSAFAILDTAPFAEVEGRLAPLMKDGRPYRVQAREALAFAKLMKGDSAGARRDFVVISQSLEAPDGARQRAKAAMDLIDTGSANGVAATVKAAQALPTPMLVGPGGVPMGLAPPEAQGQPQDQAPGPQ
ncbi:tetratricopeptide repeat protein [Phenylobacterium sp.]|uniref:tetratricopeptide repeat protein n=1 Tax=Phenylobacterium sp. TaxID=1871053 RepID=UPI002BAC1C18|nr:tetratricopeptide repeat protein [Phenylobacterium sp.]HLZ76370.1 tetratricopeptide repeat protein [Phenylobacterium sp.]